MSFGACEEWRAVAGYEGYYEVSNLGRLRSLPRLIRSPRGNRLLDGIVLSPARDKDGYRRVHFRVDGNCKSFFVHRLVCIAFRGEGRNILHSQVDHIDRNKTNNAAENLRWVSRRQNLLNRNSPTGQRLARVNPEMLRDIRESRAPAKAVAAKYGLSILTVYDLRRKALRPWAQRLAAREPSRNLRCVSALTGFGQG